MVEPAASAARDAIRVFVSYDREHDEDLHQRFVSQASAGIFGIAIAARSGTTTAQDHWDDALRRAIREADEVIVLCGEHTNASGRVGAELRIAQEEERPYFLVWGRREIMCTKPATARPADPMYSWTRESLEYRIPYTKRCAVRTDPCPIEKAPEGGNSS